jgi:hypothetical protein
MMPRQATPGDTEAISVDMELLLIDSWVDSGLKRSSTRRVADGTDSDKRQHKRG